MTRPRPKFLPTPRVWNAEQVACRLGGGESWFYEHRPELEAKGFPRKDDVLNGWDSHAIEQWLDDRGGIVKDRPEEDDWGALINGDEVAVG